MCMCVFTFKICNVRDQMCNVRYDGLLRQNVTPRAKKGPMKVVYGWRTSYGELFQLQKLTLEGSVDCARKWPGQPHFLKWLALDFPLGREHSSEESVDQSLVVWQGRMYSVTVSYGKKKSVWEYLRLSSGSQFQGIGLAWIKSSRTLCHQLDVQGRFPDLELDLEGNSSWGDRNGNRWERSQEKIYWQYLLWVCVYQEKLKRIYVFLGI